MQCVNEDVISGTKTNGCGRTRDGMFGCDEKFVTTGPVRKRGHLNTTRQKLLLWKILHLTVI